MTLQDQPLVTTNRSIVTTCLMGLIRVYQLTISGFLGPCCRFEPNCSIYATESLRKYGLAKGSFLTFRRLIRCHPWHVGGIDPVP